MSAKIIHNKTCRANKEIGFGFILLSFVYFVFLLTTAIAFRDILKLSIYGFSFSEPVGILFFPCMFVMGDVITELYGTRMARYVAITALLADIIFSFVLYLYSQVSHIAGYVLVFKPLFRISLISSLSLLATAIINIQLVRFLYTRCNIVFFGVRSFLASSFGEILLSALALPQLLGASYSGAFFKTFLILVIYKILGSAVLAPLGALLVTIIKKWHIF